MESGNAFKKTLIAEVRKHPVLFDGHRRDYKNPLLAAQAWAQIAAAVGASVMECETAFQGLRNRFTHERKRRMRAAHEPSLSHGNPWHLYDDIAWLGDFVKMRDRRPGSFKSPDDLEPLPTQAAYFPDSLLHLDLAKKLKGESPSSSGEPGESGDPDSAADQDFDEDSYNQADAHLKAFAPLLGLGYNLGGGLKRPLDGGEAAEELRRVREELEDEELLFGRVVGKTLARLSPLKRAKAKVEIQRLLLSAEFDETPAE